MVGSNTWFLYIHLRLLIVNDFPEASGWTSLISLQTQTPTAPNKPWDELWQFLKTQSGKISMPN